MAPEKYLHSKDLYEWLAALSRERRVLVPAQEGDSVVFRPFSPDRKLTIAGDATVPPKAAVFPSCRELFRFERTKDPADAERIELSLLPDIRQEPTLVFGTRPCGARGFLIFDRVYQGGRFSDPYYRAARENTLFVTLACGSPGNACFCHWVGGGPDDPAGSDLLLTAVDGGYVVQAITEKGEALLESPFLSMDEEKAREAAAARAKVKQSLPQAPDIGRAGESLLAIFNDMDFWEEVSAKCISCGACTYLCPTCYCFNITDEAHGLSGKRLRSWDTCMSHQFTLEASGHNPRPTKAHRLRNRVGHKFSYYPSLHDGLTACCGCGRCIRKCPAGVDIREIVLRAVERAGESHPGDVR